MNAHSILKCSKYNFRAVGNLEVGKDRIELFLISAAYINHHALLDIMSPRSELEFLQFQISPYEDINLKYVYINHLTTLTL